MVFALIAFALLFADDSFAASCNQVCATSADCTSGGCNVCIGFCVSCADLGNATDCAEVGTGASESCIWNGAICVPEIPRGFLPLASILAPFLLIFLFRRKLKTKAVME